MVDKICQERSRIPNYMTSLEYNRMQLHRTYTIRLPKEGTAGQPRQKSNDPDARKKFHELSAAYHQTLPDPEKRKQYNSSGIVVDPKQPEGLGGPVIVRSGIQ